MPKPTPAQVDRLTQAVEYPINKQDLERQAKTRRIAQSVQSLLAQIPSRTYASPTEVRREFERLEPSLRTGPTTVAVEVEAPGAEPWTARLPQPVREAIDTSITQGGRVVGQAGEQIASVADQQRSTIAEQLRTVASTVRETRSSLQTRGQPRMAQAADVAAQQLESASEYLARTDVRQMSSQAQDFARRQPWLVLGAGVALGFLIARVAKSTDVQQLVASQGGNAGTDAIRLLEIDHRRIRQQLRRGESAAPSQRPDQIGQIKRLLTGHERMEEEVFYPALQQNPATRELVMESFAEHQVVDEIMGDIERTDPSDEMWIARFSAMKENLEHHIGEEEERLLPLARRALTAGELSELGRQMQQIQQQERQMSLA